MSSHRIQPSLAVRERRAWNAIRQAIAETVTRPRTRDDFVLMPPPLKSEPAARQHIASVKEQTR
jgi:hypothetical protein